MLVKTTYRDFPRLLLNGPNLECCSWFVCSFEKNGIKLQACQFRDLKDFMSTFCASVKENPRITCHHGLVNCFQVAENCLKYASLIDIHNH